MGAVGHQLEGRHALFQVRKYAVNTYCKQLLHFSPVLQFISYYIHPVGEFTQSAVTVNAVSVDGPNPAARVTWNTTVPPQCVTSVAVEFRTGSHAGPVEATYTTNNASQTEIIQTGLLCATNYFIRVVVTGTPSDGPRVTQNSRPVEVLVGGKDLEILCFLIITI